MLHVRYVFVPSSTRLNTPPGVFQKQSVMPSWFCWLAKIVSISSFYFLHFCASTIGWLGYVVKWFLFFIRFETWNTIQSLYRLFYFENWLDSQCHSCVYFPAWIHLLCAAWLLSKTNIFSAKQSGEPLLEHFWNALWCAWWNHEHRLEWPHSALVATLQAERGADMLESGGKDWIKFWYTIVIVTVVHYSQVD